MTREYLIEAIEAFDPDGNGLIRVALAAKRTLNWQYEADYAGSNGLWCGLSDSCLLAHAWKATSVYNHDFIRDGLVFRHPHIETIHWFDGLAGEIRTPQSLVGAAQTVLDLLEVEFPEIDLEDLLEDYTEPKS